MQNIIHSPHRHIQRSLIQIYTNICIDKYVYARECVWNNNTQHCADMHTFVCLQNTTLTSCSVTYAYGVAVILLYVCM